MSEIGNSLSLNHLMQVSTQALYECQESLNKKAPATKTTKLSDNLAPAQTHLLLKLMETLVDTKNQLAYEIKFNRINFIDPAIVREMEAAIDLAIANPIDAKVNQIYFSIFGYNSALWQVLRDVQKLLQTMEILKDPSGKRVAKVDKKNRDRRKKRHEKEILNLQHEESEK